MTGVVPITFARKPFLVEAVQVTKENMEDVAVWCEGRIITGVRNKNNNPVSECIKVRVQGAADVRHTQAFVGDWVVKSKTTFKVFNHKAFDQNFEPAIDLDHSII